MPRLIFPTCVVCEKSVSTTSRQLFCINEEAELEPTKDGKSETIWKSTASRAWNISMCQHCANEKYERSLSEKIIKARRSLAAIIFLVLGAVAFIGIAGTGIFIGLPGPIKLALAVAFAGIVLLGLFGTPMFLLELIAGIRARSQFSHTKTIPESKLIDIFTNEAERILKIFQSNARQPGTLSSEDFELPINRATSGMARQRIATKL